MSTSYEYYTNLPAQMETRVAVISIIVEDSNATVQINEILHNYSDYIIGRMGIPYRSGKSALSASPCRSPMMRFQLCPASWDG